MTMKSKSGFTLIEALVAITILTLSITGAFSAANSAMRASSIARDQLTASYLAQEGIEYVRMLRDNAYLVRYAAHDANASDNAWNDFKKGFTDNSYTYPNSDAGIPVSFVRKIQATEVAANDEKIVSTVEWNFHGISYSVTITDHLTPWQ
jgi:prepilin-type N-terminal cleavage/methylation domain-containing protein